MGRPFTGRQFVSREERIQKNGTIYVYEKLSWYDPEAKYTRKKLTLLGIRNPETGEIIETRPKLPSGSVSGEVTTDLTVAKQQNALISILRYVSEISGITAEVNQVLAKDKGMSQKILSLSWYSFATDGRNWTHAENWTRLFLSELPYHHGPITEAIYQKLFSVIGTREEIKWSIFKIRAAQFREDELLALDSTVIHCGTKNVNDAQNTIGKDGHIDRYFKVVYIYSITSRQLVAYAKIPGNIPDCSTVVNALKQLDILELPDGIEVVQDNGYATEEDLGEYLHRKRHFITRLTPDLKWISPCVEKYLPELRDGTGRTKVIHCDPSFSGIAIQMSGQFPYRRVYANKKTGQKAGDVDYVESKVNVFIYYSTRKKGEEDEEFRIQYENVREDILSGSLLDAEARKFAEKYTETKYGRTEPADVVLKQKEYQNRLKHNGLLILCADKEDDIETCLLKFRSRETIEEGINGHKGHTGGDSTKTGDDASIDGELLIEFLANSMRESFRNRIRSMKSSLGVPNGDRDHDLKANLTQEVSLKNWIRKKSYSFILESFERKYVTVIRTGRRVYRLNKLQTKRDKLFLEKFGVVQEDNE